MDTRAVKRRFIEVVPRLVVAKSVDLGNEEDRFWGVFEPKIQYVALVDNRGIDYLIDYRKPCCARVPRQKYE